MFKKWCSIENSYQKDYFKFWENRDNGIFDALYEVTEKIHGANWSIIVEPGMSEPLFAARNGILSKESSFYGWQKVFIEKDTYYRLYNVLIVMANGIGKTIQLYGEYFGGSIQKGVNYGKEKQFCWYALAIDGKVISGECSGIMLRTVLEFKVPVLEVFKLGTSRDLYAEFNKIKTEYQSFFTPKDYKEDNICEGIVIAPYDKAIDCVHADDSVSYFYVKKKNEKFKEKANAPKRERQPKVLPENVTSVVDVISSYVCDMRTQSLYSKLGALENIKEISVYAKAYAKDVMIDFEKENFTVWNALEAAEKHIVKKRLGRFVFEELRNSLMK